MYTIRFYIGLDDKDAKKQLVSIEDATNIVINALGACTIQNATGHYKYEDGTVVTEHSLIVTKFIECDNIDIMDIIVKNIVASLKLSLNQESIAVEICHPTGNKCIFI